MEFTKNHPLSPDYEIEELDLKKNDEIKDLSTVLRFR